MSPNSPNLFTAKEDSHGKTEPEDRSPGYIKQVVMDLADGTDIIQAMTTYATENECTLITQSFSGHVKDVSLLREDEPAGFVTCIGIRRVIHMNAVFSPTSCGLTILLDGGFGGVVVGQFVASGTVTVMILAHKDRNVAPPPPQSSLN